MFNFLKKEKEPKNLKEILSQFKELKEDLTNISQELEKIKKENTFSVQKVGIVRFNPFKETGGNQSFSIALLDARNNGVTISSLYGREGNRVFAKPIKNSLSTYTLSKEEERAIIKAKNKL